jgi:hypothetical protein
LLCCAVLDPIEIRGQLDVASFFHDEFLLAEVGQAFEIVAASIDTDGFPVDVV